MNEYTQLKSVNHKIVTRPFADKSVKTEVKSGFANMIQRTSLAKLEVLVPGPFSCGKGDHIYIPASMFNAPWAKEHYVLDGQDVILVPEEFVVLVEYTKKL